MKVKLGSRGVVYLPSEVRRALGVKEGDELLVIVREGEAVMVPVKSVFRMGVESKKIGEVTVEDFERESERVQAELYDA